MRRSSLMPPPDPNADPNAFQVKDPQMRASLGLPPLSAPGLANLGAPGVGIHPLSGGSPLPPPAGSTGALGAFPPPPTLPDYGPNSARYGTALHNQAMNTPNNFQAQANTQSANSAGLATELANQPTLDAASRRFNPVPFAPQGYGAPTPVAPPTRPALGHDPLSMGLGALASIFDPRGAGGYSAAPLQASIDVNQKQYEDRQRLFPQLVQQSAQQYEAQRANTQLQNSADQYNIQGQQRGAEMYGTASDALQQQRASLLGGQTTADQSAQGLSGLSDMARTSGGYGADATSALRDLEMQQKGYEDQTKAWSEQYNPLMRYYSGLNNANARVEGAQITSDGRETIGAGHDAAHVQGAQIGADARIKVGQGNNATSTANNVRNNADNGSAPTGPAAKDPRVQNAYRSALQLQGEVGKTERLLLHAWQSTAGSDRGDNAKFAQWMHANPVWQQASTANTQAWGAYQDELVRVEKAQIPTPAGATNGGSNGTGTGPGRPAAPQSRYSAPPPGTPRVIIR
jgi:hypothetical protein